MEPQCGRVVEKKAEDVVENFGRKDLRRVRILRKYNKVTSYILTMYN